MVVQRSFWWYREVFGDFIIGPNVRTTEYEEAQRFIIEAGLGMNVDVGGVVLERTHVSLTR